MDIPMEISLQHKDHPIQPKKEFVFNAVENKGYEMEFFITEYFMDTLASSAYHGDLLHNIAPFDIGTTTINLMLLPFQGGIFKYGWSAFQPCQGNITAISDPSLAISQAGGL